MPRTNILCAGRDRPLLFTRARVLEEAGYIVTATSTSSDTIETFFSGDFDLVILCHSIPLEERERVAKLVHLHSPSTPVIALADMASRRYDFGDLTVDSDADTLLRSVPLALNMAAERKPPMKSPVIIPPPARRRSRSA